jgi:hypothetical protein
VTTSLVAFQTLNRVDQVVGPFLLLRSQGASTGPVLNVDSFGLGVPFLVTGPMDTVPAGAGHHPADVFSNGLGAPAADSTFSKGHYGNL